MVWPMKGQWHLLCDHHEADKLGDNGVMYVVCTRCGETLSRAPDERQPAKTTERK